MLDLTDLLRQCLVRVGFDLVEGECIGGGTGFWIAPGTIMTCAHVVHVPAGTTVLVDWQGKQLAGLVTAIESSEADTVGAGLWPYPDLALIEVADPPAHPCAWLCEEPYVANAPVTAIGHSAALRGVLEENQVDGRIRGRRRFGQGWSWQFVDNEIDEGMSGGPVLNHETGAVCGVMTTSRELDTARGGFLVPIEGLRQVPTAQRTAVLRAHDRFHAADGQWTARRAEVCTGGSGRRLLTAAQEVNLLGMLATLDESGSPARLHAECTSLARKPQRELLSIRDCVYALMDEPAWPRGELSGLLRLTDVLSAGAPDRMIGQRLRDWTTTIAAKLDEDELLEQWRYHRPASLPTGGVVIIRLESGALDADRYQVTIWLHRGADDITQHYCDDTATHTLAEAKTLICAQLQDLLGCLDEDVRVEFVTGVELFDERFEELVPTRRYTNLGRKYPVVLRDLDRFEDATRRGTVRRRDLTTIQDWRSRWLHLQSGAGTGPHWLGCVDVPDERTLSATLELQPTLAVLALARGPSHELAREAIEVALDHGIPGVLWRRRCPEHDDGAFEPPCTGAKFAQGFESLRVDRRLAVLPHLVRQERNRVLDNVDDNCHDIVLLWDDPDRLPVPLGPLRLPPRSSAEMSSK